MKSNWRERLLLVLAVAGMVVTTYLIYQHYKLASDSFCNVNNYVSCDIVNKSRYAEIAGMPVSIMGFAAYVVFVALAIVLIVKRKKAEGTAAPRRLQQLVGAGMLFAFASVAFSLYLTYIELFVLDAICIFCVTQQIIIISIFITLYTIWRTYHRELASV